MLPRSLTISLLPDSREGVVIRASFVGGPYQNENTALNLELTLGCVLRFASLFRRDAPAILMLSSRHFDKARIYRAMDTAKSLPLSSSLL